MMYIVPVNGMIMASAGMPIEAVITSTALVAMIATIMNGLWSNTPIAMSVGLGINSYFAFALCLGEKLPWQTVLGIVFLSGIMFFVLTLTKMRRLVIDSITPELKIAISAGIGVFIAFIGLKEMGIIVRHEATLITLGKLTDGRVLLGVAGLFILTALIAWRVKGAFIISIVITSVIGYIAGVSSMPSSFVSMPASISPIFFELDILAALKLSLIAPIMTFMLTDLFDSLGTLSGVGQRAGIFTSRDSKPIQKTLEADAAATIIGSLFGLSTTTSFIESAAGVEEGGRTGLTAVVTGLCFALTLFLLPFFKSVPSGAIYPVLVAVGVLMFAEIRKIDFSVWENGLPAFMIIALMPMTFSITRGLGAGFISYVFIKLVSGKIKDLNPAVVVLAIISIFAFIIG
jgi:AGZA family xanthine/uracil permease-like MFS transporter